MSARAVKLFPRNVRFNIAGRKFSVAKQAGLSEVLKDAPPAEKVPPGADYTSQIPNDAPERVKGFVEKESKCAKEELREVKRMITGEDQPPLVEGVAKATHFVKEKLHNAKEAVKKTFDREEQNKMRDAKEDLKHVAERKADQVKHKVSDAAEHLKERVKSSAGNLYERGKEKANEELEKLDEKFGDQMSNVAEQVHRAGIKKAHDNNSPEIKAAHEVQEKEQHQRDERAHKEKKAATS